MRFGLLSFLLCLACLCANTQSLVWDTQFAANGTLLLAPTIKSNNDYERGDGFTKLSSGKMLLTIYNGKTYVRRLLPNGTPDSSYARSSLSQPLPLQSSRLLPLSNGYILLAGVHVTNQKSELRIYRLSASGVMDTTFNGVGFSSINLPNGIITTSVQDLLLQPDGKILVYTASPVSYYPKAPTQLLRLLPDGTTDTGFGNGGWYTSSGGTEILPAGMAISGQRVILAYLNESENRLILTALNHSGSQDMGFGTNGMVVVPYNPAYRSGYITALADGRIIAGGINQGAPSRAYIFRYLPDGQPDLSFGYHGSSVLFMEGYYHEGKSLLADNNKGVYFVNNAPTTPLQKQVVRIDSNGIQDLFFGDWGVASVAVNGQYSVSSETMVSNDGALWLSGRTYTEFSDDYYLTTIDAEGNIDSSFGMQGTLIDYIPTVRAHVGFLRFDSLGNTYAKYVPQIDGESDGFIKITTSGTIDSAYGKMGIAISDDYTFDILSNGRLLSTKSRQNKNSFEMETFLRRYTINGRTDSILGINGTLPIAYLPGFGMWQVRTLPGNKAVVYGSHRKEGTSGNAYSLLWLNSDGQLDSTKGDQGITKMPFNSYAFLFHSEILPDGSMFLGGNAYNVSNIDNWVLIKILPDGNLDHNFGNAGVLTELSPTYSSVNKILPQPDGNIILVTTQFLPGGSQTAVARYTSSGEKHSDFKFSAIPSILPQSYLVLDDGNILSYHILENNGNQFITLTLHKPNGELDSSYGTNGSANLAIAPNITLGNVYKSRNNILFTGWEVSEFVTKVWIKALRTTKDVPVVSNFTLVDATSDKDLQPLENGATINIAAIRGKRVNIRANTANAGSVLLQLSGQQQRNQTESALPYALFGNTGNNYWNWTPATGSYTLKATPYSGAKATGTAGASKTIQFTITDELTLSGLTLINAATNRAIRTLTDGAVIDLAQTPGISIRANTGVGYTESVRFGVNGTATVRMENAPPYSIAGDNLGDYNDWMVTPGTYTITATPYSFNDGAGKAGTPFSINVQVVNSNPRGAVAAGSTPEMILTGMQVYPNPAVGDATLSFTAATNQPVRIWIADASGNKVQQLSTGTTQQGMRYQVQLPLGRLPAGVYNIMVSEGGKITTRQVVKH